jgi:methyl-accepting chemotaxis protein
MLSMTEPLWALCANSQNAQHQQSPQGKSMSKTVVTASAPPLDAWRSVLTSSLASLRQLAGATEHDFLQMGSQMQAVYQQAINLSQTAQQLVATAAGEQIHALMERLRQILLEMQTYLERAQVRNLESCEEISSVGNLLHQVATPIEGFRRMGKQLYIFEVLIKIESTYLGEMEGEFVNLAIDIKKLSQQIKEKTANINNHISLLNAIITNNISIINKEIDLGNAKTRSAINETDASLSNLEQANNRFLDVGRQIALIADKNSENISDVVQAMQFHDIFRQQVEHVIESIEALDFDLPDQENGNNPEIEARQTEIIVKTGDVCELQQAQLQFASLELFGAVTSIVDNLRSIGAAQKQMTKDIYSQTGSMDSSGASFLGDVARRMALIAELLSASSSTNATMADIMQEVIATMHEVTGFVADIQDIGHEIIQIALNARIKAACTGSEGAAMSALSEEVGQLSEDAVQRTGIITRTLTEIHAVTEVLSTESGSAQTTLGDQLSGMQGEVAQILTILESAGAELFSLLQQVQSQVNALTGEIESVTNSIDVHKRTKTMAERVLADLEKIFTEARAICPASAAFKEDLRRMAEKYTMESERRIHEEIARKHGVTFAAKPKPAAIGAVDECSEFGDNVDLF